MDYKKIASEYKTPLFIFDIDNLKERCEYLKNHLPNMDICYAVKANSFVVKEISEYVSRLEICSEGEYHLCEDLGIDPHKMVLSGVNKNYEEFDNIIKNNDDILRYTIESVNQFNMLKELSSKYKRKIMIMPRYTSGNQFGMNEDEIIDILNSMNEYMEYAGIEFFSGTQKHSISRIEKEFIKINKLISRIEEETGHTTNEIEYGTGFPVYYFIDDEFDEENFFKEFNYLVTTYFKDKQVILEIGRSLVASSGVYLTKVADFKCNNVGKYVILDGGINHLVYYGSTMAMKVPYFELFQEKRNYEEEIVTLCGSLCTVNDILVKQVSVPKLNVGDLFVFKNTGAYSVTEGINLFLSRDLPKILLIKDGCVLVVRDEFKTYKLNTPNYVGE